MKIEYNNNFKIQSRGDQSAKRMIFNHDIKSRYLINTKLTIYL